MPILPTRLLPRTGLAISVLGLGCAPLGNLFSAVSDEEARAVIEAAWQSGLRYFDTAPFYGYGLSEHRLGEVLRGRPRDEWVLSTKVGRLLSPTAPRADRARAQGDAYVDALPFEPRFDYRAGALRRSIEDSLQRIGTHRIDIAYVHDIGRVTHGEKHESYWAQLTDGGGLRELESMRREGLVGAIGLGVNEWRVVLDAMQHIDLDCCMLAGRYTLLEQGALQPFLAECTVRRVGVVAAGLFNSGILASAPGDTARATFDYAAAPPEVVDRVGRLRAGCEAHGVPLAAAALQFAAAHPAVVSSVVGVRSVAEWRDIQGWWTTPIPTALWADLKQRGLIAPKAPVPQQAGA